MQTARQEDLIRHAIDTVAEAGQHTTGGKWLEVQTAQVAHYIREWDIIECWPWSEWPANKTHWPTLSMCLAKLRRRAQTWQGEPDGA